jgi:hypothetical protein
LAERDDDGLIREIDEELRQEQAQKLWKTYGKYVIGVAVVVVFVVAGYQGWTAYDQSQKQEATDSLIGATSLADSGDTTAAIDSLANLEAKKVGEITVLASLRHAALIAKEGDKQASATAYYAIADDTSVSKPFRDLASILGTVQSLDQNSGNAQVVIDRLKPLIDTNSNWRHSAREISAVAAIEMGQIEQAKEHLQAIALDAQAPSGVRSRAQEQLQAIGQ